MIGVRDLYPCDDALESVIPVLATLVKLTPQLDLHTPTSPLVKVICPGARYQRRVRNAVVSIKLSHWRLTRCKFFRAAVGLSVTE